MTTDHGSATASPGAAGRSEMDGEHHIQLSLLYALREAVDASRDDDVHDILERLIDYSKMHFASEQLLMRLYQYGDYERHALDHEQMMQQFDDLRSRQDGGGALVAGALDDIERGLADHIRWADAALGEYLANLSQHPQRTG